MKLERYYTPPVVEPLTVSEAKEQMRVETSDDDTYIGTLIRSAREMAEQISGRAYVAQQMRLVLDDFPAEIRLPFAPVIKVDSITYVDTNGTTQTLATSVYTVDTTSEPARVYRAYNQIWPSVRIQPNAVTITYTCGHGIRFTAATNDVLTLSTVAPTDDDRVFVTNIGGTLPAGLSANTPYYVISSSGQTCSLSTSSGGGAVDITDTGSGTHFIGIIPETARHAIKLMVADAYANRESVVVGRTVNRIKPSVDALLAIDSLHSWGGGV